MLTWFRKVLRSSVLSRSIPWAAALLLLAPAAWSASAAIRSFSGPVSVKAVRSGVWDPLQAVPHDLSPGDQIRTGPSGQAEIVFGDGSKVAVQPSTEFTFSESDGARTEGRVRIGVVRVWVRRLLGRRFTIRTPSAVCSVRGTRFQVLVLESGLTAVDLFEGLLAVSDMVGGEVLLRPNESVEVLERLGEVQKIPVRQPRKAPSKPSGKGSDGKGSKDGDLRDAPSDVPPKPEKGEDSGGEKDPGD